MKNKPIKVTFFIQSPRSGSYALSQILKCSKLGTSYDGQDLHLTAPDWQNSDLNPFENTQTFLDIEKCLEMGINYACFNQSVSARLLIKAIYSLPIQNWIAERKMILQTVFMRRDIVSAGNSLHQKCQRAGIEVSLDEVVAGISRWEYETGGLMDQYNDILQRYVENHFQFEESYMEMIHPHDSCFDINCIAHLMFICFQSRNNIEFVPGIDLARCEALDLDLHFRDRNAILSKIRVKHELDDETFRKHIEWARAYQEGIPRVTLETAEDLGPNSDKDITRFS